MSGCAGVTIRNAPGWLCPACKPYMHVGHLTATTQNNSKEESWLHIAFLTNQRKTRTRNYFYVYIYLFTNSQIQWRSYLWSPFGWMVLILFLPWRKSDEHEDIPETFFWELIIFIIIIRLYKRKLTQCNSDTYLTQWQQRYWSILHCNLNLPPPAFLSLDANRRSSMNGEHRHKQLSMIFGQKLKMKLSLRCNQMSAVIAMCQSVAE